MRDVDQKIKTRQLLREHKRSMRSSMRSMRIQYKLLLALVLLSLFPLIISGVYAAQSSSQTIRQKTSAYSLQLVSQVSYNLDTSLQKIKDLSDEFIISPDITNRLFGYTSKSPMNQLTTRNFFFLKLQLDFLNMASVDDALMVFYKDRQALTYDVAHITEHYQWPAAEIDRIIRLDESKENTRNVTLSVASIEGTANSDIVLGRRIVNAMTGEVLGHLMIAIRPEYFTAVYENIKIGEASRVFIVDSGGTVLNSQDNSFSPGQPFPDPSLIQRITTGSQTSQNFVLTLAGTDQQVSSAPIGNSGLYAVLMVPVSYLNNEVADFISQLILLSILVLVLAILISLFISRGFAAPLKRLAADMTRFGKDSSYHRPVIDRSDEIGDLQKSFNTMTQAVEDLMGRIKEENKIRRLSELRVLEYQINPHFLYNALDSINWMAQKANQPEIGAMVTALARFYRLGLSKGREFYTIKDEINHVQNYLTISQLRHKDTFQFSINVDPDIMQLKTLRIILQPLVENAIKYGMRRQDPGVALIQVTGQRQGDQIILAVSDNGNGIEPERLNFINQSLAEMKEISVNENGFGLLNVHQRLRLNYGEQYGVVLDSKLGSGTTATINIPVNR